MAEKDNTRPASLRRRVRPQLPAAASRLPGIVDEYALYQRFLPTITLDEINKLAQELVPRSQPRRRSSARRRSPGWSLPDEAKLAAVHRDRGGQGR